MVVKELFAKLGLELDEGAFAKGEAAIHGLHLGFVAFATAAVTGAAVVGAALTKNFADSAVEASKLAQQLGLPLEATQELAFAAGTAADALKTGLRHLAQTGVKDLEGELFRLAERFKHMPDGAAKLRLAFEKLGRGGQDLIPFLNKGPEKIHELMEEAKELGVVLTAEDVVAAKEFKHELHLFEEQSKAAGYAIGRVLLPYATKLVKGIRDLTHWVKAAMASLLKMTQVLKTLALVGLAAVLVAIGLNIGAIITAISWYGALSIAAVSAAISAAVAWIAAAAPIVAIIALVAVALLVLEDLYQFFTGGESLFGDFVAGLKSRFGDWTGFWTDLVDWLKSLWNGLTDWLGAKFTAIGSWITDKLKAGILAGLAFLPGGEFVASKLFSSGAQSPAASVASSPSASGSTSVQQTNQTSITINPAPGMDEKAIGMQVRRQLDEHHDLKMREAVAGVGG